MIAKKINLIILAFLLVIGVCIGYIATSYCSKCIIINARKDIFYGKLAMELKKELKVLGYNFNCPKLLPKTVIDFTYTNPHTPHQNKYIKRKIDTNIVLVADCFNGFDIEFLKSYDFMLVVSEYRFGYLAMFNFKGVHFPLRDGPFKTLCGAQYDDENINIKDIAIQLDDVIQRAIWE